ncbi:FAD-dependent oxidoreductase [Burkholderia metallica]|nr:FAD-dependent oxidoreductase [Burkholderia metallica]
MTIALGCNGRGIAMATTLGKHLAAHRSGDAPLPLPFQVTPIRQIPFRGLQRFRIAAGVAWYRLLDSLS